MKHIVEHDRILELKKSGASIRRIVEETGLKIAKVRLILIKAGLHSVVSRKIHNGYAICTSCKQNLPLERFQGRAIASKFLCDVCSRGYLHIHQIKKRGCSIETYETLAKKQDGCCAICNKTFGHISCLGAEAKLAVDHNHETKKVRGLLCGKCNRGLGWFNDSVELLQAAINYLNETQ